MQRRLGSLASSLNKQVQQLSKGAQQIAHNIVLLQKEQARIQSAIKELTKRKSYKRQYIQVEKTLIVSKVLDLITKREGRECALRGAAAIAARLGIIPAPVR
jgi:predicted  nucleic acid-binding Zn-ribbon protein